MPTVFATRSRSSYFLPAFLSIESLCSLDSRAFGLLSGTMRRGRGHGRNNLKPIYSALGGKIPLPSCKRRVQQRYMAGGNKLTDCVFRSLEWCRRGESNPRPRDYETLALPLSYAGIKQFSIVRTISRECQAPPASRKAQLGELFDCDLARFRGTPVFQIRSTSVPS